MPWMIAGGMGLSALGGIGGGLLGSSGAKKQARAMMAAINYQKQKDAETQARFVPYQELGKESVNQFQQWRDDPTKNPSAYLDPGYQFRRDQGNIGITNNAAASGMLQSGDTLRALTNYGQDSSSQEYNNAFQRWLQEGQFDANMVGMGQNAAGQQGQLAMEGAGNVGRMTENYNPGASDQIWGQALAGVGGMAGNAFARRIPSSGSTPTTPGGSNIFLPMQPQNPYGTRLRIPT